MHQATIIIIVLLAQLISVVAFSSIPPALLRTTITTATISRGRMMLTRRTPQEVQLEIKDPVDPDALLQSRGILDELRSGGSSGACSPDALLAVARRFGDVPSDGGGSYVVSPERCREAFESLTPDERRTLLNIHARVKVFAEAQRGSVVDMEIDIPGGKAGQTVSPCRGEYHSWFRFFPLRRRFDAPLF
jgi:histidinol dehydrogenase